jgi:hypothetical protein
MVPRQAWLGLSKRRLCSRRATERTVWARSREGPHASHSSARSRARQAATQRVARAARRAATQRAARAAGRPRQSPRRRREQPQSPAQTSTEFLPPPPPPPLRAMIPYSGGRVTCSGARGGAAVRRTSRGQRAVGAGARARAPRDAGVSAEERFTNIKKGSKRHWERGRDRQPRLG